MRETAYRVYWTAIDGVQCQDFLDNQLVLVLEFMEGLRRGQREGQEIQHIALSINHPDSVGQLGVDKTGPDYDWKKRRS